MKQRRYRIERLLINIEQVICLSLLILVTFAESVFAAEGHFEAAKQEIMKAEASASKKQELVQLFEAIEKERTKLRGKSVWSKDKDVDLSNEELKTLLMDVAGRTGPNIAASLICS